MKKNFFSILSLWRKYKILLYSSLTVILVMFMTLNVSAAGFEGGKSSPIDNPQQVTVRGVVTDATTGDVMPGVNIVVVGTSIGAMTGVNGDYSLQVPSASATIQFSFIGYVGQVIALNGRTTLDVALMSDIEQLSEVVVIGYGTARKSDLTGSVTGVQSERLLDKPTVNVGQALASKVSGVQVIQMGAGVPGGNPMIRIRGTNSISTNGDPLFVVDGIVGVANALSNINPEDIVTIDVLKDASSTAIYGARGANGVIIMTTKRGISGKTQVDFKSYVTASIMGRHLYSMTAEQMMYTYEQSMANVEKYGKPNRTKDFRYPYATGLSYSEMPWLFVKDNNYPVKLLGNDQSYYAPRYDWDWEAEAYGPSISNTQYFDVRGGGENAKFSLAAGYSNQNGLMIDSHYTRYNAKLTGDIKITKWLDLASSLSYIQSEQTDDGGITRSTAEVWPIVPIKYPDDPAFGNYALRWGTNADFNVGEQWYNIVFRRDQQYGITYRNQVTGSIMVTAQITPDLSFKTDFSTDFNNRKSNSWSDKYYGTRNSASISNNNSFYWQNQNYFNYQKVIGDHSITGLLGLSWSRSSYENLNAQNRYFFTGAYVWHNLGAGNDPAKVTGSSDGTSSLNSYFGRLNYAYKGKYLITGTARIDGSSKFGENSKYGVFPSVGAAWRVSKEDFISNIAAISDLKVRGSWGITGNQEIGSYVTQRYIGNTTVTMGSGVSTGIYPSSVETLTLNGKRQPNGMQVLILACSRDVFLWY